MGYNVIAYDNSRDADEPEVFSHSHGYFKTWEEAENAAKAILNEFLILNWSRGMRPEGLIEQYCLYGDDLIILPEKNPANKEFSARDYVNKIAESICKKLENE